MHPRRIPPARAFYLWAKPFVIRYLIIGQGLAGTLIGYRLERAGHDVHYLDAPNQTAASSVAAGIVNPITGRRFVRSWRIEELIPAARTLYGELENLLGERFWFDQPLVRTLYNRGDENDWQARSGDEGYAELMDDGPELGRLPELTEPVFAYAGVRRSARVEVGTLVRAFREKLIRERRFTEREVDYSAISLEPEGAGVAGLGRFDRVVFCEGWRSRFNPWFGTLPWGGNKGEVLDVATPGHALLGRMFKHRVFLVPRGDGRYWIGATSENRFADDAPTADNRTFLEARLAEVLRMPFVVEGHRAAVRPTVRDRRPVIGPHAEHDRLWVFNGLGTKGASLAPLTSAWLLDYLERGARPPAEVDIRRFR